MSSNVERAETSTATGENGQKSGRKWFKKSETKSEKKRSERGVIAFLRNLHKRRKSKSKSGMEIQVENDGGDVPVSDGDQQSYPEYPAVDTEQYDESSEAPQLDEVETNGGESRDQQNEEVVADVEAVHEISSAEEDDKWERTRWAARSLALESAGNAMPSYKQVGTEWETDDLVSCTFLTRASEQREEADLVSIKGPDALSSCHSELVPASQTAECASKTISEWELTAALIYETCSSISAQDGTSTAASTSGTEETESTLIALAQPCVIVIETIPLVEASEQNVALMSGVMSEKVNIVQVAETTVTEWTRGGNDDDDDDDDDDENDPLPPIPPPVLVRASFITNREFMPSLLVFVTFCLLVYCVHRMIVNNPTCGFVAAIIVAAFMGEWERRARYSLGRVRQRAHFDPLNLTKLPNSLNRAEPLMPCISHEEKKRADPADILKRAQETVGGGAGPSEGGGGARSAMELALINMLKKAALATAEEKKDKSAAARSPLKEEGGKKK